MGETLDQTYRDRVAATCKNNRDRACSFRSSKCWRQTNGEDHVYAKPNKLRGELRETLLQPVCVAPFNKQVFSFDVAELSKSLLERSEQGWTAGRRAGLKESDLVNPLGLLRARRNRPERRYAETGDELASLHGASKGNASTNAR